MVIYGLMDVKTFQKLFRGHRQKISEAWNKLSDKDLEAIRGDLEKFLEKVAAVYKIPDEVILKELDVVKKNIEEGIEMDFGYRLNPEE